MEHLRAALFLDRDGVINRRLVDDYVRTWEEFELLAGAPELVASAVKAGLPVILVTNQRGIARGLMTRDDLEKIHRRLQEELLRLCGSALTAIYVCPHERDAGCDCRKPRPGMLLQAARDHAIDLHRSWMVGDSESDIEAGAAAGCRTLLVTRERVETAADLTVNDLSDVWPTILASDPTFILPHPRT